MIFILKLLLADSTTDAKLKHRIKIDDTTRRGGDTPCGTTLKLMILRTVLRLNDGSTQWRISIITGHWHNYRNESTGSKHLSVRVNYETIKKEIELCTLGMITVTQLKPKPSCFLPKGRLIRVRYLGMPLIRSNFNPDMFAGFYGLTDLMRQSRIYVLNNKFGKVNGMGESLSDKLGKVLIYKRAAYASVNSALSLYAKHPSKFACSIH